MVGGVKTIKDSAFYGGFSLKSVVIPSTLEMIDDWGFAYCDSITDIYYMGTEEQWNNVAIDSSMNSGIINATVHYNYKLEK